MTEQHSEHVNPDGPDLEDLALGTPGPAEPLPDDDASQDEPTAVNSYEEDDQ